MRLFRNWWSGSHGRCNDEKQVFIMRWQSESLTKKLWWMHEEYPGIVKNQKIKKIPILRGVINFIDSLVLGMRTLMYSASFYDEEDKAN